VVVAEGVLVVVAVIAAVVVVVVVAVIVAVVVKLHLQYVFMCICSSTDFNGYGFTGMYFMLAQVAFIRKHSSCSSLVGLHVSLHFNKYAYIHSLQQHS
jgi:hypothetical protein